MTDRIDRLRKIARGLGADAAIVSHPANRAYFSGFPAIDHAPDESSGVLLITDRSATLFTSPTNLPWAAAAASPPVSVRAWVHPWSEFLGTELQRMGLCLAAFEDTAMSVADHASILASCGETSLAPFGAELRSIRAVKDGDELSAIAEAARITDSALAMATDGLKPGVTERELAWQIERIMHDLGADGSAFSTCVAAGPNGARPHHNPTDRPLAEGEPIVIDLGARVRGYCGDLTRTIVIGDASPEFRDRYNTVLESQVAAIAGTRAGVTGRESDSIARDILTASGFGEQFVHGLGHGVGLLIHEYPSLSSKSDDPLLPGQVVTIEPGIYLEGWGGIRIEDLCVVTPTGLEVLSHAPK